VFVDFDTQRRIAKRSAAFYQQVLRTNRLPPLDAVLIDHGATQASFPAG
jgi:hypothetical protein